MAAQTVVLNPVDYTVTVSGTDVDVNVTSSTATVSVSQTGPQGATGPAGATGATGPAGSAATIAIGTTTATGPTGTPSVTNSGTSSAAVFDFVLQQGATGAKGDTGNTGPQGPSGVIAVTAPITNTGTSTSANIGIDQSGLTLAQSQVTNLSTDLAAKATALDEVIPTDPNGAYFDGTGLRGFGVNANYASTPDAAALDITGDIDIRVKVALNDWTPSVSRVLVGKYATSGNQRSYGLRVNTNGTLILQYSNDGTTDIQPASTVATGFTDGSTNWVRATLDVDNGASGRTVTFYTSTDGTTWTQLGNTVTTAGTTSIFSGTAALELGSWNLGTQTIDGNLYRVQVLNGIGGTTVFDANFETVPADSFAFAESSSNAATVTLTTTRYSFGIPGLGFVGSAAISVTQNNSNYFPAFVKGKSITIRHLAFEVTTAPSSTATARLAVYAADAQMQPTGTPLWVSGAISVSSAAAAIYRIRVTPFTMAPGNYVLAFNTTVTFTVRAYYESIGYVANTLGANSISAIHRVSETLSGDFGNPATKWTSRVGSNVGTYAFAMMGWS